MKKETKKEFGKLIYDFSKIGGAIVVITPLAQDKPILYSAIVAIVGAIAIGTYIINSGANNG